MLLHRISVLQMISCFQHSVGTLEQIKKMMKSGLTMAVPKGRSKGKRKINNLTQETSLESSNATPMSQTPAPDSGSPVSTPSKLPVEVETPPKQVDLEMPRTHRLPPIPEGNTSRVRTPRSRLNEIDR